LYYRLHDRQINIDYSICQALKQFPGHVQALIIYDICCQWIIHFRERVSESEFLELWNSLEITGAMGKWHLTAHIAECFPKVTLNFVEGAGEVEGEILETLWSGLDKVAGLAQAMSIAHHQETVDDHMNDSNWWKIIRIGRNQ
jgi:Kyakuja-Dileera-Zisupton transposase